MFEFEYIPLILMVVIGLHTFIMRRVNSARAPYRMALAGRFHELKEAGASDWLLDFWLVILGRASFSHGQLKWGILAMLISLYL